MMRIRPLSVLDIAKCRPPIEADANRESQLSDDDGDATPSTGTRTSWDTIEHIRYMKPREPPSLEPNQAYSRRARLHRLPCCCFRNRVSQFILHKLLSAASQERKGPRKIERAKKQIK